MGKGSAIISTVIIMVLIIATTLIVYKVLVPKIREMKSMTYFEEGKDILREVSSSVSSLILEGSGARRVIDVTVPEGAVYIKSKDDSIIYKFRSYAKIVDFGAMVKEGGLLITSGHGVKAYASGDEYILENDNVLVSFKKLGNSTNFVDVDTSELINYVEIDGTKYYPKISVKIDYDSSSLTGEGYTELLSEGEFLNYGELLAHVHTQSYNYTIVFTLGSAWDYITIEVKDVEEN